MLEGKCPRAQSLYDDGGSKVTTSADDLPRRCRTSSRSTGQPKMRAIVSCMLYHRTTAVRGGTT